MYVCLYICKWLCLFVSYVTHQLHQFGLAQLCQNTKTAIVSFIAPCISLVSIAVAIVVYVVAACCLVGLFSCYVAYITTLDIHSFIRLLVRSSSLTQLSLSISLNLPCYCAGSIEGGAPRSRHPRQLLFASVVAFTALLVAIHLNFITFTQKQSTQLWQSNK